MSLKTSAASARMTSTMAAKRKLSQMQHGSEDRRTALDFLSRRCRERLSARHDSPPAAGTTSCRLLERLPAELRELVWAHAVTEWQPDLTEETGSSAGPNRHFLKKRPIRIDKFNRPLPPAITSVCRQTRHETLHLYYQHNVFECWRPLLFREDMEWTYVSTFGDWLCSLGAQRRSWLLEVVLLFKHENELEYDMREALADADLCLPEAAITQKQELSEYEMCYETLGLPRHFGKKSHVWGRWVESAS